MSITDELRKEARGFGRYVYTAPQADCLTAIADRIDAEHERELAEQQDSLTVGMQPMTEENMAEGGWVRGPLDADGKMWRSGDMSDSNWGVIEGIAYEDGRWLVSGHDTSAPWIPADSIRHYHEPTVEDVLREFAYGLGVPDFDGKPMSDAQRYKACGNRMAVPVMRWIGERIQMGDELDVRAEMEGNAYGLETMLIEFDEPCHKRASFMCDGRQYVIDWVAWCFDHGQGEVQVYEGDGSGEPKSWHDLMTVVGADPDLRKWAREFVRTVVG